MGSVQNGQQVNNEVDPSGVVTVVGQFNSSGNLIAHYTYGIGLVSEVDGSSNATYYDFDQNGDTIGITDAAGQYVNRYSYLPFGQVTTLSAGLQNLFTFDGQFGTPQLVGALFQMRARTYSSGVGQFLSNDPIGLGGDDTNTRRFVGNDPVEFVDPTGDKWVWGEREQFSQGGGNSVGLTFGITEGISVGAGVGPTLGPSVGRGIGWPAGLVSIVGLGGAGVLLGASAGLSVGYS